MKFSLAPSRLAGLAALIACVGVGSAAAAQDVEGDSGGEAVDAAQAEAEALDPDDPLYWAKVRDVFTVQKRPFVKEGRVSATLYVGLSPNNDFETFFPLGVRVNYFVLENIGVELSGSWVLQADSKLEETLVEGEIETNPILLGDTQRAHASFAVLWSPLYGKSTFYESALNYFDVYVAAGAGLASTETQSDFNEDPTTETSPKGVLGAGLAYYIGQRGAVRLDFRQFLYSTKAGGLNKPSEVSLGGSFFF